jgi:hypothetical protein
MTICAENSTDNLPIGKMAEEQNIVDTPSKEDLQDQAEEEFANVSPPLPPTSPLNKS